MIKTESRPLLVVNFYSHCGANSYMIVLIFSVMLCSSAEND